MNGTTDIEDPSSPIIFLLGPPGVGKSTLGRRACTEIGLEFLDLGAAPVAATAVDGRRSDLERLTRIVADCAAPSRSRQATRAPAPATVEDSRSPLIGGEFRTEISACLGVIASSFARSGGTSPRIC